MALEMSRLEDWLSKEEKEKVLIFAYAAVEDFIDDRRNELAKPEIINETEASVSQLLMYGQDIKALIVRWGQEEELDVNPSYEL
jgi:hypothetical protein